jgi:integrase
MILHVINGKGHKDRDLPLSPALLETLRAHWRWLKPRTSLALASRSRAAHQRQDGVAGLYPGREESRHS